MPAAPSPFAPSSLDPLLEAVSKHGAHFLAQTLRQSPERVHGSFQDRVEIMLAAMPWMRTLDEKMGIWDALEQHRFRFPRDIPEGEDDWVARGFLEHKEIELVQRWRALAPDRPWSAAVFEGAMRRCNLESLDWWIQQGWPIPTYPAPTEEGYSSWLPFSIAAHQLEADAHVAWLLAHGVEVRPTRAADCALSRLAECVEARGALVDEGGHLSSKQAERAQTMWLGLVEAGADPRQAFPRCETPVERLNRTPLGPWWTQLERTRALATDLDLQPPPGLHRPRFRG